MSEREGSSRALRWRSLREAASPPWARDAHRRERRRRRRSKGGRRAVHRSVRVHAWRLKREF